MYHSHTRLYYIEIKYSLVDVIKCIYKVQITQAAARPGFLTLYNSWLVFAFSVKDIRACMTLRANTGWGRKVNRCYRSCAGILAKQGSLPLHCIALQGSPPMAAQEGARTCSCSCTSTLLCNIHSMEMPQSMTQTISKIKFGRFSGGEEDAPWCADADAEVGERGGGQVRSELGKLFTQVPPSSPPGVGCVSPQIGNTYCTP